MGLFGGTKTYVASTLYNLAGEPLERPNYLKSSVLGGVVFGSKSLAQTITNSYLAGPGMKLRSFFRWAEDNYDGVGVPTGSLGGSGSVDADLVLPHVPKDDPGNTISLIDAEMGAADYSNWVEQWLLENDPDKIGTAYEADIDEVTGFIDIVFEDETEASFLPDGYAQNGVYLYVAYTETDPGSPAIPADPEADPPTEEIPAVPDVVTTKLWIYRMGTGNAELDALIVAETNEGEYLPHIPIRLDNKFLSPTYKPDSYELAKKAYKKVSGGKLDKIIESLEDNESLGDIDFAYLVFAVPLNVLDQTARQYLYRFFDRLRLAQTNSNAEWLIYQDQVANGVVATAPRNTVHIKSTGTLNTNLNMKIIWNTINRETGAGLGKPGAKAGDYWQDQITVFAEGNTIRIWHQIDDDSWERLVVIGAKHINLIYNNKSVDITGKEALEDPEESGFLVPIHYDTLRDMGLKDGTQLGTQCTFLVLNSYLVKKLKWYETGIFKIFVFVAVIAITVVTAGAAAPASVGLLGSAAAVGAAVGLTGTLALIAGAVINALAAMLLMKLISMGAVAIFGEKLGAIIGAVVSVVAITVGTGLMNGSSLSASWGNMMSAQNLIQLTSAVGQGVAGYVNASTMETIEKTQQLQTDYEKASKELSQKFADEFGYDKGVLDPLSLTDAGIGNAMESQFQFLSRTLMTGTDIAEMSKDMLNNFAEYTLTLKPGQAG